MLDRLDYECLVTAGRAYYEVTTAPQAGNTAKAKKALKALGIADVLQCSFQKMHSPLANYIALAQFALRIVFIHERGNNQREVLRQSTLLATGIVCLVLRITGLSQVATLVNNIVGTMDLVDRATS